MFILNLLPFTWNTLIIKAIAERIGRFLCCGFFGVQMCVVGADTEAGDDDDGPLCWE